MKIEVLKQSELRRYFHHVFGLTKHVQLLGVRYMSVFRINVDRV